MKKIFILHPNKFGIFLVGLTLFVAAIQAAAADPLTIIELQNKSAEEIIPVVRPLLHPESSITGKDYTLFLKASPQEIKTVKAIVARMDYASIALRISVLRGEDATQALRSVNVGIQHNSNSSNSVSGRIGEVPSNRGSVAIRHRNFDLDIDEVDRNTSEQSIETINTISGEPAFIRQGVLVPLDNTQRSRIIGPQGQQIDVMNRSTQFYDARHGFYVIPELRGAFVQVSIVYKNNEITPGSDFTRNPTIDSSEASSNLRVALGEWVEVGNIKTERNTSQSVLLGKRTVREKNNTTIAIKIDRRD